MTRIAFILLIALAILPLSARAQSLDIVTGETVAIAFYKFAGLRPNFSSWAEDTPAYHEAPPARRERVQAQEAERLQKLYDNFSMAGNLLNVSTAVEVTLEEMPQEDDPLRKTYALSWKFAKGDADFFPYEYRDTLFALVPREVEKFQTADITEEQYIHLKDKFRRSNKATAILQLRGQYADSKAPVHLRGADFWALAATVAGISLWDSQGAILWENTASWYVTPRTQSLNDLHQAPGGQ